MLRQRPAWNGLVVGAVLSTALCGCASYTDDTKEIRSLYRSRSYAKADKAIEESTLKETSRHRLLYLTERSMIQDRLGKRATSRQLLMDADRLVDKLYTTSISKEALTYLYNDSAQNYPGEDYEKVAIHTMLAMSFIEDKKLKEARVEAARINTKLLEINNAYKDKKNRYGEDAFARYLAGAIYEARGEWDSAIIDYTKALKLYSGSYQRDFFTAAPDHLVTSLYRLLARRRRTSRMRALEKSHKTLVTKAKQQIKEARKSGELVVFHEVGTIAIKTAYDFFIPFGKQVVRLSFPIIKSRFRGSGGTGVSITGVGEQSAELAQNMDQIAMKTLEDRRLRLIVKQGARLLTKGQLTEQAHRNFGPIAGIAANIYSAFSETADTRSWTLLPRAFYVTRRLLKPGTYQVAFKNRGRKGPSQTVTIKKGAMVLLRDAGR